MLLQCSQRCSTIIKKFWNFHDATNLLHCKNPLRQMSTMLVEWYVILCVRNTVVISRTMERFFRAYVNGRTKKNFTIHTKFVDSTHCTWSIKELKIRMSFSTTLLLCRYKLRPVLLIFFYVYCFILFDMWSV